MLNFFAESIIHRFSYFFFHYFPKIKLSIKPLLIHLINYSTKYYFYYYLLIVNKSSVLAVAKVINFIKVPAIINIFSLVVIINLCNN